VNQFAGIDWGGYHHQLCIVDEQGKRVFERRVAHDREGLEQLRSALSRHGACAPIAVERAEGLLVESLLSWDHSIYAVSPRISARARERYRVASSKDDTFDAFVLADTLRHERDHWRPLSRPSEELSELRALTRDRRRLVELQRTVESQLRATLETYHPAVARLFSAVDRDITIAFLRDYPSPEEASRVGEDRMRRFLARHSYRGRVPAEVLVERLRDQLLATSPGTTAARRRFALAQADQLELLNRQLRDFDRAVGETFQRHPDAPLLLSFPGIATVLGASVLAELGEDRARYPQPSVLLAEAGLAPVTRSSGRMRQVRFRYAANRVLRDACNWWAFTSIRLSSWARNAYDTARARGHHHHRALRGLAARWMRILWRCWQDRSPYDPERHLALASAS
jgi:transposase